MLEKAEVKKILSLNTEKEIRHFIEQSDYFSSDTWLPYGGKPNNKGVVEGQMKEPENALIEKVTNSIDAILMRKCYEEGIEPSDEAAPKSMIEAVSRYFGGRSALRKKRSQIAKEMLRLQAQGRSDKPSITVIDKGEGQEPAKIPKTILSLNEEIKAKVKFVYGTYNQGGSGALKFCGDTIGGDETVRIVQLVLCRRAQSILKPNESEHFGFTFVRKRWDVETDSFRYEYFVDSEGKIPMLDGSNNLIIGDYKFTEGCVIRLYDYQLKESSNIVLRGLNETINKKLSYTPLPIYLQELRKNFKGGKDYTIFGFKEKLENRDRGLKVGYPRNYPVHLGSIGKKKVKIFVFQHKSLNKRDIKSYLGQKEKVFYIRNGMTLHTENVSWLRNDCGLADLAPYLFAFIDISEMDPKIAQMLHSSREAFSSSNETLEARAALADFLSEMFKGLNDNYGRLTLSSDTDVKSKELQNQLEREATKNPELKKLFSLGKDFTAKKKRGKVKPKYQGDYLPKKFEVIGDNRKTIERRTFSKVSFKTEAEDELLVRSEDPGKLDWSDKKFLNISYSEMKNGVIGFRLKVNPEIEEGREFDVTFSLKVPTKSISFTETIHFKVIDTPDYEGEEYPSYFNLLKGKLKIPAGGKRQLRLATDVEDNYFVRKEGRGTIEFPQLSKISFVDFKLNDGFLNIVVKHNGSEVEKIPNLIIGVSDDTVNRFEIEVPVEIIPPQFDEDLKLPKLMSVEENKWTDFEPEYTIDDIARIPNWQELKRIEVNIDSLAFNELAQMQVTDREKARKVLRNQIFFISIWLYFELKDYTEHDNGGLTRDQVFNRSLRGVRRVILSNIKKLIR